MSEFDDARTEIVKVIDSWGVYIGAEGLAGDIVRAVLAYPRLRELLEEAGHITLWKLGAVGDPYEFVVPGTGGEGTPE